jgi:hypothetical protein
MKKEELKCLIEEHLVLRKRLEELQKEREKLEGRHEKVRRLLYGFRSQKFLRSVLLYLLEAKIEHGEQRHLDDLVHSIIHSLTQEGIEEVKKYPPKHLLYLYDEEVV